MEIFKFVFKKIKKAAALTFHEKARFFSPCSISHGLRCEFACLIFFSANIYLSNRFSFRDVENVGWLYTLLVQVDLTKGLVYNSMNSMGPRLRYQAETATAAL